jgi:hypothetical protein
MVWQEVIEDSQVWVYEYIANGYKANAIAFLLDENNLAIVSPPIGLSEADFSAIDAKGNVTTLIAPSSAHDGGQAEWQNRYPAAIPYAPTIALNQLEHVGRNPFRPLTKLSDSTVKFREVPGTKKGGTIAISRRGTRPVVYLDELVINWSSQPDNWTKLLFWLTGSAPGSKVNRVYLNLFCPDKQVVAQTVLDALEDDSAIVPAHGTPLVQVGDAERIRAIVEPLSESFAR